MNKFLKATAAALLSVSTLAGCSSNNGSTDTAKDEKPTEILIGISPDYPPYESKSSDGKVEGFDVDMTEWLFNYLNENGHNYTYDFQELSFDTIITSLQAGQIDLGISGFTYDEEREGIFSDSYYDSAQVLVVKNGSDIKSVDDLDGKKVGAQQGTTGEDVANDIKGAEVSAVKDAQVMMESLKADGIDAVVLDKAVADNYAATGDFSVVQNDLLVEENIIYTTEDHKELLDQINEAIKAFKDSDEYPKLVEKWMGSSEEAGE